MCEDFHLINYNPFLNLKMSTYLLSIYARYLKNTSKSQYVEKNYILMLKSFVCLSILFCTDKKT